jgi:hypothetical protein
MLSQRSKYLVLGLIGIGFISFVATFTWMVWSPSAARKPALTVNAGERSENGAYKEEAKNSKSAKPALLDLFTNEPAGENEKPVITAATQVVQESRYRLCGHVEVGIPIKDPVLHNLGIEQLTSLYPMQDGWEVVLAGPERVILRMNVEGLCPHCAVKRHLGVIDGKVAIFYGPVSFRGGLDRLTNLPVSSLPLEWQEPIRMGMMEFENAEALSQALDSLDEFR